MVGRIVLVVTLASVVSVSLVNAMRSEDSLKEDTTCSKYRCKSADEHFVSNTCIFFDIANDVHILNPCDKGYICTPVTGTNSTCFKEPPVTEADKYPGENCKDNTDCVYGTCQNDICDSKTAGAACEDTLECNTGLYCDTTSKLCTQLKTDGAICSDNYECGMHSYCQIQADRKVCAAYFTVKSKTEIESCDTIAVECESLYCYEDDSTSPICFDPVVSAKDYPTTCSQNTDCLSSYTDQTLKSECSCGYNENGDSYCSLFGGDEPYQKLIKASKAWLSSSDVEKCNSARRRSIICMQDKMSEDDFWNLKYYYLYVTQYAKTIKNDKCVKEIYTPRFYEAEEKSDDSDDDDGSSYGMALAALLALLGML